jgi:hypothetical protein
MLQVIPTSLCLYAGYLHINQGTHIHTGGWNCDPVFLFHSLLLIIAEHKETPPDIEVNTGMYGEQNDKIKYWLQIKSLPNLLKYCNEFTRFCGSGITNNRKKKAQKFCKTISRAWAC